MENHKHIVFEFNLPLLLGLLVVDLLLLVLLLVDPLLLGIGLVLHAVVEGYNFHKIIRISF